VAPYIRLLAARLVLKLTADALSKVRGAVKVLKISFKLPQGHVEGARSLAGGGRILAIIAIVTRS
jgi:hypothetical protein